MKVGDLVKFRHDDYSLFGHGVVLEKPRLGGSRIRYL